MTTTYYKVMTGKELKEFDKEIIRCLEFTGEYPKKIIKLVEPVSVLGNDQWGVYYQEIVVMK
jgi:hypothetical protein